ncbi:hypothetical protein [Elongatibacter sediminis]|uniref:Uncharacterized protein n=1 Tax=Elongatibacter sediminis TaxID=3119006 RepID=A0AAW9RMA5_9GAMM
MKNFWMALLVLSSGLFLGACDQDTEFEDQVEDAADEVEDAADEIDG